MKPQKDSKHKEQALPLALAPATDPGDTNSENAAANLKKRSFENTKKSRRDNTSYRPKTEPSNPEPLREVGGMEVGEDDAEGHLRSSNRVTLSSQNNREENSNSSEIDLKQLVHAVLVQEEDRNRNITPTDVEEPNTREEKPIVVGQTMASVRRRWILPVLIAVLITLGVTLGIVLALVDTGSSDGLPGPTAAPTNFFSQSGLYSWVRMGQDIVGAEPDKYTYYAPSLKLSADGKTLAVATLMRNENITGLGQVQVLEFRDFSWHRKGQLLTDSGLQSGSSTEGTLFASSIDISDDGNTLAIGSRDASNKDPNLADHQRIPLTGEVTVYRYDSNLQEWKLKGSPLHGDATSDDFGKSVSLSGDGSRLLVGAPLRRPGTAYVRIFDFQNEQRDWVEQQTITREEPEDLDVFGSKVELSQDGNSFVVTAPLANAGSIFNGDGLSLNMASLGLVQVYRQNVSSNLFSQLGDDIVGEGPRDFVETAGISADGECAAVGGQEGDGYVYVSCFNEATNQWTQTGNLLTGDSDKFGESVVLSSDAQSLVVSHQLAQVGDKQDVGNLQFFQLTREDGIAEDDLYWELLGAVIPGTDAFDQFGQGLTMSRDGRTIAASAQMQGDSFHEGIFRYARVFQASLERDDC